MGIGAPRCWTALVGFRAAIRKLAVELLSFLTLRVQGFGFRV